MNKNIIFYHIHNPDIYSQFKFAQSDQNSKWIMMVREPIQSCESWIKTYLNINDYQQCVYKISYLLMAMDNIIFKKNKSIGVRLEDLKKISKKNISTM